MGRENLMFIVVMQWLYCFVLTIYQNYCLVSTECRD
jgi:hypothetical protein